MLSTPILSQIVETEFAGWQSQATSSQAGQVVRGGAEADPAGGRHFVVRHGHHIDAASGTAPLQVGSAALSAATYDPAALGLAGTVTFSLSLGVDIDPGSHPGVPPHVLWSPAVEQGGVLYRPFGAGRQLGHGPETTDERSVRPGDWRPAGLDLSPGGPPVRIGVAVESVLLVVAQAPQIEARIAIDDLRVDPRPPEITFGFETFGGPVEPGKRLYYEIEVRNTGVPEEDLMLFDDVPAGTTFLASESSPGWTCDPGPDAGGECRLHVGPLPPNASMTATFAVVVDSSIPPSFEVSNEVRLGLATTASAPKPSIASTTGTVSRAMAGSCNLAVSVDSRGLVGCSLREQTPVVTGFCCVVFAGGQDDLCGLHCVISCPEGRVF